LTGPTLKSADFTPFLFDALLLCLAKRENPQTLPGLRAGGKQRGKFCLSVFAQVVAGCYTMDAVRQNPSGVLQEKRAPFGRLSASVVDTLASRDSGRVSICR